jgi:peptide-methionine (R)-S-oxide reductase
MFEQDRDRDQASERTTRRMFLGGAAAVALGALALRLTQAPGIEASTVIHGTPGTVTIVDFSKDGTRLGSAAVAKVVKTDGEWYRQLGRNSYGIARMADTETPYFGVSWKEHRRGLYRCIGCATALFSSATKYDSGTGWPSFWDVLAPENVAKASDRSMGVERTEVRCARCEAHLGHVFPDGPEPTGLRYCMNSASMQFVPA